MKKLKVFSQKQIAYCQNGSLVPPCTSRVIYPWTLVAILTISNLLLRKLLYILFFYSLLVAQVAYAQEVPLELEKASVNLHDKDSLKRGAKFFSTVCMACHTLIYMRYDKIAQDEGVVYERMPINVKKWPMDIKPPDLSLEASRRGADWIYTYLHSFYADPSQPTGANNLLVPKTGMPGIMLAFEGQQIRLPYSQLSKQLYNHTYEWYDLLEQTAKGSMTPEQFDATINDVVNFLVYASEPYKVEQERIGWWVIFYFIIMFILMYLLKRTYWKDVESKHK